MTNTVPHLYSGRMSMAAYSKAVFLRPARLHSMMVEVRMGTTCLGNLEMDLRVGERVRERLRGRVWERVRVRVG